MYHKITLAVIPAFVCISLFAKAQEPASKNPGSADKISSSSPAQIVDPKVSELLQKMGDLIKNSKEYSFHAEILYDDTLPSGQKIQFTAAQDVYVKRPDKVFTEYASDVESREFWYNGKSFTLLDRERNLYSTQKAEPTIDGTLVEIMKKYGYMPALSDFLYSDPYKTLVKNVLSGFYVGPGDVNGIECYHLAFVEKYIDWQMWIEAGDKPLVKKLVITYKTVPESPQYIAVFSDWKFDSIIPDSTFEPALPAGAKEINMMVLKNVSVEGKK
jgi:hypothetical protein